jgi:hypothetical protein
MRLSSSCRAYRSTPTLPRLTLAKSEFANLSDPPSGLLSTRNTPPDAVSSSRAIKASRTTAEAFPARRPGNAMICRARLWRHAKPLFDGWPVEVTGFQTRAGQ